MTARTLLAPLLAWTALYGIYVLLAGQATADELGAGAILACLGTALSVAVRAGPGPGFRLPPSVWAPPAASAVASVPRDAALVAWRLLRPGPAGFEREPLQPLPADTTTTRAVRVLAGSFAPNSIVAGLDGDTMIVHRLAEPGP